MPYRVLRSHIAENTVWRAHAQFSGVYWLQEPAALAVMQSAFNAGPVEQFGPPSAELWTAVLVRCNRTSSGQGSSSRGQSQGEGLLVRGV